MSYISNHTIHTLKFARFVDNVVYRYNFSKYGIKFSHRVGYRDGKFAPRITIEDSLRGLAVIIGRIIVEFAGTRGMTIYKDLRLTDKVCASRVLRLGRHCKDGAMWLACEISCCCANIDSEPYAMGAPSVASLYIDSFSSFRRGGADGTPHKPPPSVALFRYGSFPIWAVTQSIGLLA